jgi:hypothetical protein
MITRNGRTIIGSVEAIVENHLVVVDENAKLKRELARAEERHAEFVAELVAERDALKKHIEWLHEELRFATAEIRAAYNHADGNVRELYRARDIAKAKTRSRGDADALH